MLGVGHSIHNDEKGQNVCTINFLPTTRQWLNFNFNNTIILLLVLSFLGIVGVCTRRGRQRVAFWWILCLHTKWKVTTKGIVLDVFRLKIRRRRRRRFAVYVKLNPELTKPGGFPRASPVQDYLPRWLGRSSRVNVHWKIRGNETETPYQVNRVHPSRGAAPSGIEQLFLRIVLQTEKTEDKHHKHKEIFYLARSTLAAPVAAS